jgi:outer membrane immunogenic protein
MKLESKVTNSTTVIAAAASSTGAMAADLDVKAPAPVAALTWQGLYEGGSVGASWLNSLQYDSGAVNFGAYGSGTRQTATGVGFMGSLDVGYNWEDRNFVFGVEADFSWLAGNKASSSNSFVGYVGYTGNKSSQVQDFATFRGRFGFDLNGTMPYLTAGFAEAEVKNSYSVGFVGGPTLFSSSKTTWDPGVALGGGIEHQFNNHWSVKGEMLWVGLKETSMPSAQFRASNGDVQFSNSMVVGRFGVNYRF